jgi:hypothetical protein
MDGFILPRNNAAISHRSAPLANCRAFPMFMMPSLYNAEYNIQI